MALRQWEGRFLHNLFFLLRVVMAHQSFQLVYDELRRLAGFYMRSQRPDHTLQPTALVHEAYLKLAHRPDAEWNGPRHFKAMSARVMRSVLVDYARAKSRQKRNSGGQRLPLEAMEILVEGFDDRAVDLLALNEALEILHEMDPRQAEIVELRFFGGLTVREVSEIMNTSERTVERDWRHAKAWLYGKIS